MVDGKGQARRFLPEAKLKTEGINEWVSEAAFDFVSSEYLEGFAPDPFPGRSNAGEVDRDITHRRVIFYVKNEYWILCDIMRGQGAHKLEQVFRFAPLETGDAKVPLRAGEVDVSEQVIVTRDNGVGNLAILPVDGEGVSIRKQKGETSPAVGWWGMLGEFPVWDVTLELQSDLPARSDAVMWPQAAGVRTYPTVERLVSDDRATAFRVVGEGVDDLFILCEEGTGEVTVGNVTFEGRALLLRREDGLKAMGVGIVSVTANGQDILV